MIEKAKDAQVVGIVVGTLGVGEKREKYAKKFMCNAEYLLRFYETLTLRAQREADSPQGARL
jgi:diphthamide synthase subunit DPH2